MVRLRFILLLAVLAGCASNPPLPPECEGELTPINGKSNTTLQGVPDVARPRS